MMRPDMGTKCMRIAFEIGKIEGFFPIETEAGLDGIRTVIEDVYTGDQYEIYVKRKDKSKD